MPALHRPPRERHQHSQVFTALGEAVWQFPKHKDIFQLDQQVEFFAECVFYERLNLGLCRKLNSPSKSISALQFEQLETLSELIFELTKRRVSVFDIVESCEPSEPVRFPVVNAQLVFDWFISEVISGGGFNASDEQDFFVAVLRILGPNALEIDLTDSSAVTAGTINRLDTATVANGSFSRVLYDRHTLPFKIKLIDLLDRLYIAVFDTPYEFVSNSADCV